DWGVDTSGPFLPRSAGRASWRRAGGPDPRTRRDFLLLLYPSPLSSASLVPRLIPGAASVILRRVVGCRRVPLDSPFRALPPREPGRHLLPTVTQRTGACPHG